MNRTIYLSNGTILFDPITVDFCNSITVTDGYVHAQNTERPLDADEIDLKGGFAIPAFIDSHVHLLLAASFYGATNLLQCESKIDFQNVLLESTALVDENQWLVASGWSLDKLGAIPTKSWFPDELTLKTICYQTDLHCAVVNQSLLNHLSPQHIQEIEKLPGGQRVHDGIIMEDALFDLLIPMVPPLTQMQLIECTKNAIQELHSHGITLVGSMENFSDISSIFVLLQREKAIRMRMMCLDQPTPKIIQQCKSLHQDDFLTITGFKSFLDGSFGSRTAKMYSGWLDSDGAGVWAGHAASDSLQAWVKTVSLAGYAPVLHAIGDEAVGLALHVLQEVDPSLIPRIEHAQCIASSDIERVQDIWFGVQPLHEPVDRDIAMKCLGKERLPQIHNWRRMIDHGAKLSFGSDWPVIAPNPLESMRIAIKQGLTPEEALIASTAFAAQSLRSTKAGHLKLGAYGDIVVLDKNPLDCDWIEAPPSVTMTIQNGTIVYSKDKQHA